MPGRARPEGPSRPADPSSPSTPIPTSPVSPIPQSSPIPQTLRSALSPLSSLSSSLTTLAGVPAAAWFGRVRPEGFGCAAEPTGERLERIRRSPQFVDGAFRNPVRTRRMLPGTTLAALQAGLTENREQRRPARAVPVHRLTADQLALPAPSGLRLTWLGHAGVLAEIGGRRVLFDPVFGERCSPIPGFGPRRLHPNPIPPAELGPVDVVVISHDHYDHLDLPAVRALATTGAVFAVPLGVGAHLEFWGVPPERVLELDWHESAQVAGLSLTAAPARHYCSRGPRTSRYQLWASWIVTGGGHRLFHSGDTGYFPGFAEIGAQHGPFDAAMIQVGAYSRFWPEVHMTPEEGVRAHLDLGGKVMLPIHWCTFDLAPHPWEEPMERTLEAALAHDVPVATPRPGEAFEPAEPLPQRAWWRAIAAPGAHEDVDGDTQALVPVLSEPTGAEADVPAVSLTKVGSPEFSGSELGRPEFSGSEATAGPSGLAPGSAESATSADPARTGDRPDEDDAVGAPA